MTDKLPPNLLALFAPRPPLRYLPPCDAPAEERMTPPVSGVVDFLPALAEYKDNDGFVPTESWLQRRDRRKEEQKQQIEKLLKEGPAQYDPNNDPNIRGDAFKTLIVARLSYEANEQDLEREFARFGTIERIRIIKDTHADEKGNKKRKPHRGYAFVVFEREKDMRAALDGCDGMRIKDRRIKVDVERGRTVEGWKPRRLGGGLGGRGYTKAMPSQPMGRGGFGGGFRGGFRGGFGGPRERGFRGGGGRSFSDRGYGGGGGGGGGYQGPRGGDRQQQNGFGGPPPNAPGGPGSFGGRDGGRREFSGRGGYDSRDGGGSGRSYDDNRYGGDRGDRGGGGGGDRGGGDRGDRGGGDRGDRGGGGGGWRDRDQKRTGSNMEPIRPRENGGYRDRDYDRPRDDDRKRGYEGSYEDPRKLRRY